MADYPGIANWQCDRCSNFFLPGGEICVPTDGGHSCHTCRGKIESSWECDICGQSFTEGSNACVPINEGNACFPCLKSRMDGMIESEDSYPPVYGDILPCPAAFVPALFDGVAEHSRYASLFDMRMTEYRTPVDERLYCNCDAKMFLGRFIADPSDVEYESAGYGACSQLWCLNCGQKSGYEAADIRAHEGCKVQHQREAAEKAKQYEGLTRGVGYQFCVKCHRSVRHDGGCNHMTCTHCHGNFCYVCGVEAKADSGHWREEGTEEQELGKLKCLFVGVDAAGAARKNAKRDQPGVDMNMQ